MREEWDWVGRHKLFPNERRDLVRSWRGISYSNGRELLLHQCQHGEFSAIYGGCWLEEMSKGIVIAVAGDLRPVIERVEALQPFHPVRLARVRDSLRELEALSDEIMSRGQELEAPLSAIAPLEQDNTVDVMLADLDAPASRRLMDEFAGRPVIWTEGTIIPA